MAGEDWARIFTTILCHTSLDYEQIKKRTIPQINAILEHLPENVRTSCPFFGGGGNSGETKTSNKDEEHSTDDGMAFAAMFHGI